MNRLQQCASFIILIIPRREPFVKSENINLTKPDKYVTIVLRRTAKTVGGSNLPPEMEVSLVDILSVVIQLLHLILDAIKVTFDLSNKKR